MMLKDNLYKILSVDLDEKSFKLELIPDCVIFRAHFPGYPVAPGVCIIQIASELLEILLGRDLQLSTVSNAKFLAIINPLETGNLVYTFKKIVNDWESGDVKVSVVVSNSDKIFTKLSLVYNSK